MWTSIPTLSVVIPTYQRPEWFRRAILSLAAQRPAPHEIIAVVRDTDLPTHLAVAALQAEVVAFPIRKAVVAEPGFIPPVRLGLASAHYDIVAIMDDDAEATEGWTSGLLRHYRDPHVGGVGGRYINMAGDRVADVPETSRVGYVSPLGRFVGNMYKRPTFSEPVDVDFLMGGCMSFRRTVAQEIEFDLGLNNNVAFGYEVDVGLQVRARGWRLVFDPAVAIRHYSAPRELTGMRVLDDGDSVRWCSYNETRIALRRLRPHTSAVALLWSVIVGTRRAPGLLPWLLSPLGKLAGYHLSLAQPAIAGRIAGMRSVWRDARSGNATGRAAPID